ncbi:MAG: glutamine--tRNA ligase/YqeY domain fusion protein [Clostridiales bacterium]|nr:glutamine--tRNA ligase/YqeY domain fusion protein [Clostridiales bacterium]
MDDMTSNFIHDIIDADLAENPGMKIHTRFPPEPNGYLHIGSAKAIWINWSIAKKYGGLFNLRYDDTNPEKEDNEYVEAIYNDLMWLGTYPNGGVYYGSDYFDKCFEYAVKLIKEGKAYVCDLSKDDLAEYKGSDRSEASKASPYRNRTPEENLELFERMKNGEFPEGSRTLRAKIDPASDNFYLRDPVIYRIKHVPHQRQGNAWCIYPMYDFAHPIQDALEGITHSLCDIGFENHRPLYEWVIENCGFEHKPKQREFARLNMTYTIMSKRYLRRLVEEGVVDGWDDPRMPTLCGLRRRGYTPTSILTFIERAGVGKANNLIQLEMLEHCLREELNATAPRRVVVAKPLKVIVENYPEGKTEYFSLPNNPQDPAAGTRELPFTRELYIDADDFAEFPPPKFYRLKPGGEVRLMGSYIIKCVGVDKAPDGSIEAIRCTADLESGCSNPVDGRKIKGTIHWLSAAHVHPFTLIYYDKLFTIENVSEVGDDYIKYINPDSLIKIEGALGELSLADARPGDRFQFVRNGYFCLDTKNPGAFNRIVGLKDSFPKN